MIVFGSSVIFDRCPFAILPDPSLSEYDFGNKQILEAKQCLQVAWVVADRTQQGNRFLEGVSSVSEHVTATTALIKDRGRRSERVSLVG